ncbi:MAG: hypothetical protein AVDCRST_MAG58-920 [uncultured Rubrobacteraceae bacterium]|uniref:Uncharacterized protein n=1 Tax=uncultured Rubrobacteraceae bacterium TaxID=349277 RepID=A0A6J4QSK1_9ACTN|nr:MAG: hypothetical protein AVDCRST_MAG58-920 [uncultured Rubrobacteraceae bacterium]
MTPRTQTRPFDDKAMWRRLVACAHPDAGGDHDLFIWTGAVKAAVCGGGLRVEPKPTARTSQRPPSPSPPDDKPRIPYPDGADFEEATRAALRLAGADETYGGVLSLLVDCYPLEHLAHEQGRGACYKRLAAIAHAWGMTKEERSGWYRCAECLPLSDRHAGHILSKLKRQAA